MLRVDAHPDRGRGENLEPFDVERPLHVLQKLIDHPADLVFVRDRIEKKQELVAADAGDHVRGAQIFLDSLGDLDQQRITDRMTEVVVDVFEIVEVEKRQCETAAVVAGERFLDPLLDEPCAR